jgi:hypothetical protein
MYYRNYIRRFPNTEVNQALHTKILKTFFAIIVRKVINEMFRFEFPGLGMFYIIKYKYKLETDSNGKLISKNPTNWYETKKVRSITGDKTKKVVYLNEHTYGYTYKIKWDKRKFRFVNRSYYSFITSRELKRTIASVIKSNIKPLNAYVT